VDIIPKKYRVPLPKVSSTLLRRTVCILLAPAVIICGFIIHMLEFVKIIWEEWFVECW
jgi:hypothetical protein